MAAWEGHLESLGITALQVQPDPVKIASEGALWGAITAQGLLKGCKQRYGHPQRRCRPVQCSAAMRFAGSIAERLIHKLDPVTEAPAPSQRRAHPQRRFWWLYADLKAYQAAPDRETPPPAASGVSMRIFTTRKPATPPSIACWPVMRANKEELLVVLDRPEVPLNTNGSENDIRTIVTRRKISGGTRSEAGKQGRDTFLGLMKTCKKLGISYWDYLGDRLKVPDAEPVPPLQGLVRQRCLAFA